METISDNLCVMARGPDEGEHADTGDGSLFEKKDWKDIGNLAGQHLRLGLTERKTMSPKPPICG